MSSIINETEGIKNCTGIKKNQQLLSTTPEISKYSPNSHLPRPRLYSYIKRILGIHREFSVDPVEYRNYCPFQ